jgi:hypothetical protein
MHKTLYTGSAFFLLLIPLAAQGSSSSVPVFSEVQKQYRDWYARLVRDTRTLHKRYRTEAIISKPEIDKIFRNSIAPNSRMTGFIAWLINKDQCTRTTPAIKAIRCQAEYSFVFMASLHGSKPAGSGGKKEGWDGLVVYIDMGKEKWNPYRDNKIPKSGTFIRKQYPMLVFKKINGKIVLWAVSTEITKVMEKLHFDVVRKR